MAHGQFERYLVNRTSPDGSDVGPRLVRLFEVLDTPAADRQTTLDPELRAFPYVNGGLFRKRIGLPDFDSAMRSSLVAATRLDWSDVSPAIFGAMFQGVMDPEERRSIGAHYTSERNILRVIKPLFLDRLYARFAEVADDRDRLRQFHRELADIHVLDPACGCGNFLVITYRELRRIEHRVAKALNKGQQILDVGEWLHVDVSQMNGIELEEFPSMVAQTALWLTDHQMNLEASRDLGRQYNRIPLKASANIVQGNALTTDWGTVVDPNRLSYIVGNPPFIGQTYQSTEQKAEVKASLPMIPKTGALDFVTAWYGKAVVFMKRNPRIQAALVSTNSVTQGEQAGILWTALYAEGVKITFAYRTFKWTNEAKGTAAVHCVIIGFGVAPPQRERALFEFIDISSEPIETGVRNITPYLTPGPDVAVVPRSTPYSPVPPMRWGNKPTDGGAFILTPETRADVLTREPYLERYIRRYVGSENFLDDVERYCLWLVDVEPQLVRDSSFLRERVDRVRTERLRSKAESTRRFAAYPTLFRQNAQPSTRYLAVPEVSSERRPYIPMAYLDPEVICSNTLQFIPEAPLDLFAMLTSRMHMTWVRLVAGRLKSDYRYSNSLVYNTFAWPDRTNRQRERLQQFAQAVLEARDQFPGTSLAVLYDPVSMPPALAAAHSAIDLAVDRLFRDEPFPADAERNQFLLNRYNRVVSRRSGQS